MRKVVFASAILLVAGCATNFNAPIVRAEIERQMGAAPVDTFEAQAGTLTMALANKLLELPGGTSMSDSRVTDFQIAMYDLAPSPKIVDFTTMPARGWQSMLRVRDNDGSAVVLARMNGDAVADLVVLVSDTDGALFGRVSGLLSKKLQQAIVEAVKSGGRAGVKRELGALSE